jgi:hypothetical protein
MMNKSLVTNLIAILVTVGGYYSPMHGDIIQMAGLFALSGAITNWLAVHMLFEKVPLLYGSGVIPSRFEEFKAAIKHLIITEFFSKEHIERFFADNVGGGIDDITSKVDFDKVFLGIVDAIEQSSFGNMLAMVGGREALDPLKEPIIAKLKGVIAELASGAGESGDGCSMADVLMSKVGTIIDGRLEELTPEMVKKIVQDMIRKHLGWLVVWGGVFGGLIGLAVALLN